MTLSHDGIFPVLSCSLTVVTGVFSRFQSANIIMTTMDASCMAQFKFT